MTTQIRPENTAATATGQERLRARVAAARLIARQSKLLDVDVPDDVAQVLAANPAPVARSGLSRSAITGRYVTNSSRTTGRFTEGETTRGGSLRRNTRTR